LKRLIALIYIPKKYKTVTFDELKDELFGEVGAKKRNSYEAALKKEIRQMKSK